MAFKWWVAGFALLLAGWPHVRAAAETPAPRVLFDFESADDLGKWRTNGVSASLAAEHATHGAKAVKLVFQPGDGYRTFIFETGRDKLDLAGYTHLVLDVFASEPGGVTVRIKSNNGAAKWQKDVALEAGANRVSLSFETAGIDATRVDYIGLMTGDLKSPLALYVDNIRAEAGGGGPTAAAPATAGAAGDRILFDFETPDDLAKWDKNGATVELSTDHVTHGKHSAMLVFKPGEGLRTFLHAAGRKKMDLSGCTHLCIDYFAPVNMEVSVKLKSTDGTVKWERSYALEPDASSIVIPLDGTGLDPATIDYINLFTASPRAETILFVDNIRGTSMKAGPASNLPGKPELPDDEAF